jgi:hypothetical protein
VIAIGLTFCGSSIGIRSGLAHTARRDRRPAR